MNSSTTAAVDVNATDADAICIAARNKLELIRRLCRVPRDAWSREIGIFVERFGALEFRDPKAVAIVLIGCLFDIEDAAKDHAGVDLKFLPAVYNDILGQENQDQMLASFLAHVQARSADRGVPEIVSRALEFVRLNYNSQLTNASIAAAINSSEARVVRAFRRQLGVSLHWYVTQLRMREAMRLIRSGDKIEAVSALVGYISKRAFYRQFVATFGTTPAFWRRRER